MFVGRKAAVIEMTRLCIAGKEAGMMSALDAHDHDHEHDEDHEHVQGSGCCG
jgi:pyridoxine 5-phosphate synthase